MSAESAWGRWAWYIPEMEGAWLGSPGPCDVLGEGVLVPKGSVIPADIVPWLENPQRMLQIGVVESKIGRSQW